MMNKGGIQYAVNDTASREARCEDGKMRKHKKFRAEWMEEEHLKDWLQPYPVDNTMCHCTACDILLRCGKSELEKHATGRKHTKNLDKVLKLKAYSSDDSDSDDSEYSEDSEGNKSQVHNNTQTNRFGRFPSKSDDQIWIPPHHITVASHAELSMDDKGEEEEKNDTIGFIRSQQKEKSSCDDKLTEALVKLFEFADGKVDLSRKRLEMLQEEHALKLQILEKELRLKTLEVEIKETELRKLRLESIQCGLKDNQTQQSAQLTVHDHQLHVISDQHFQDALQAQLQQFQSQFEHHQSQEAKGVNN